MRQPKHKRTAAQQVASAQFAKAGRSAQAAARAASIAKTGKPPPRSKKQHQAALRFAAAGRAAQARRRAGLKPLPKHQPALALGGTGSLHDEPVCAAVAIAEHLAATMCILVSDADILALGDSLAGGCLADYLEAATAGFAGVRLTRFWPCDEDVYVPGLVYGMQLRGGYHAVLAHPAGMVTWGHLMPWPGRPCEAWHLEWESIS